MTEDPILAELHKYREELAAKFNYDVHAIAAEIRRLQQTENRQVIAPPARPVPLPAEEPGALAAVKARVSELLQREKTAGLTPAEAAELNDYLDLEYLERLARARLRRSQTPGGEPAAQASGQATS